MQVNRQILEQFEKYLRSYEWISIQFEHLIIEFENNHIKKGKNKERILSAIDQLEKELRVLINYFLKFNEDIVVKDLKVHESFFKNVPYVQFIRDSEKHVKKLFNIFEKTRKTVNDSWGDRSKVLRELKFFHRENHHWIRVFNIVAQKIREIEEVFGRHGLRYFNDPHFPKKLRYYYSRDCGEEIARNVNLVENTYSFLSKYFGKEIKTRTNVYFLNKQDWYIKKLGIIVPYGIGRCEYYEFFRNRTESKIFFPKDFPIEKNPVGRQMLAVLPFLVCHETTHLFQFANELWLPDPTKTEIFCNLVAFRVGRARLGSIIKWVNESLKIARKLFPGKDYAYFFDVIFGSGGRDLRVASTEIREQIGKTYIFLQIMLWQAIITYFEKNGFGDLIRDTHGVRRILDTIKW